MVEGTTINDRAGKDQYGFYGCGSAPYVVAIQDISYDAENFVGVAALTSELNETPTAGLASPISENSSALPTHSKTTFLMTPPPC